MKNFEGDSAVLLQGEGHYFKDPKAIQSAYTIKTTGLLFFPLKLSLQPNWQHKGHLVYSQICSSTELYLFWEQSHHL